MNNNRAIIAVLLLIGFLIISALQAIEMAPSIQYTITFLEILAVLSALIFALPGAFIGVAVAVVAVVFLPPGDTDVGAMVLTDVGRLAVVTLIIGLYSARAQQSREASERHLMIDPLTGLYNYGYFVDRLDEERRRSDRFGSRVSLLMIDIDNFRALNERHGRKKANDLLKGIADILNSQVRGVDIVSRYGGEEFAVLLPNTGRLAAQEIAERIRQAVEENEFQAAEGAVSCTVSGGIATYPDDAEDDLQLIDRVDEAVGKAKEEGRNRIFLVASAQSKQETAN